MKKVIVVSKTHLDLGFTDFAENIRLNYIHHFIPDACKIAERLNTPDRKKFVWTTGSWILREALRCPDHNLRETVIRALKEGNLAPHAMPFTLHTELLDADTLEYGLSVTDELDAITGRKTTAAKMTDVPGHTAGLVPILAKHGIKLLHIGVNGASAIPDVPECFLWRHDGAEIIVVYAASYGGSCTLPFADEILYFSHTVDNRGAKDEKFAEIEFEKICALYPEYQVQAGRMDDFADAIWEKRSLLPVFTGELGDSWIHGAAADPYKAGALRELIAAKNKLSAMGYAKQSNEYRALCDQILCLAEHTCGLDQKMYLSDYENYLRRDFETAKAADDVQIRHPFRGRPYNLLTLFYRKTGEYKNGSYRAMEKSWAEQRAYIEEGLRALPQPLQDETARAIRRLHLFALKKSDAPILKPNEKLQCSDYTISINQFGAIDLSYKNMPIFAAKGRAAAEFTSYGKTDYNFWFSHYTRDFSENYYWSAADFGKPLLEYATGYYPEGIARFTAQSIRAEREENGVQIIADLVANQKYVNETGCPAQMQIIYRLADGQMFAEVAWQKKAASRLPEMTAFRLYPVMRQNSLRYRKCGSEIDPMQVVSNGNRKLAAVESLHFTTPQGNEIRIKNCHAPLVGTGDCNILRFDNALPDPTKEGLTYILHNNIWGTNFPQWYSDDARFLFEIKI